MSKKLKIWKCYTHFRRRLLERYGLHINRQSYDELTDMATNGIDARQLYAYGNVSAIIIKLPKSITSINKQSSFKYILVGIERNQKVLLTALPSCTRRKTEPLEVE